MKPVLVTLAHDPQGLLLPHLQALTDPLKRLFGQAYLSIGPVTWLKQSERIEQLAQDEFFQIVEHATDLPVGEDLRQLYTYAAEHCAPETILHLCFADRVAFALRSEQRNAFCRAVEDLRAEETPLLFQRSAWAWAAHPANYQRIEGIVTEVGELLYGKRFDFAWCHLAVQAGSLRAVLPHTTQTDFSICAELVLLLRDSLATKDVDWLTWEDPFLLQRDGAQLKQEREQDPSETRKRLHYALPMLQVLYEYAGGYEWTGLRIKDFVKG
ncbi:MAG: hypothetical protein U0175_35345 [Caldilineaceae bacterium]